jgi:hypothetical protein
MDLKPAGQIQQLSVGTQPLSADHLSGDGPGLYVGGLRGFTDQFCFLLEVRGLAYSCWCAIYRGHQTALVSNLILTSRWADHPSLYSSATQQQLLCFSQADYGFCRHM